MKNAKLFSALTIILAVAITTTGGAFAQAENNNDAEKTDKQIYLEDRKKIQLQLNDQRQSLKQESLDLKLKSNNRVEVTDKPQPQTDIVQTVKFTGKVSGWAIVNGQAIPATFDLSGEAKKIQQHGWKLTGTANAEIGKRNVTFDIIGYAKGNHVIMKGTTTEFDSVVLRLNGFFAPIQDERNSFALAFKRAAIINENAPLRIPMILVGQVDIPSFDIAVEAKLTNSVNVSGELDKLFS